MVISYSNLVTLHSLTLFKCLSDFIFHSGYINYLFRWHLNTCRPNLHSTLFILILKAVVAESVPLHHSTFHSVYINTQKYSKCTYTLSESTFHFVYINTYLSQISNNFPYISTFHSVYINTRGQAGWNWKKVKSTFHSVYINTQDFRQSRLTYPDLHSTLFILILGIRELDSKLLVSTFHSVYINT